MIDKRRRKHLIFILLSWLSSDSAVLQRKRGGGRDLRCRVTRYLRSAISNRRLDASPDSPSSFTLANLRRTTFSADASHLAESFLFLPFSLERHSSFSLLFTRMNFNLVYCVSVHLNLGVFISCFFVGNFSRNNIV